MKNLARTLWICLLALFTSAALAQAPAPERRPFSQAELDSMLAPIALYPDALLSQILMAATYPQELFEAASWSRVNSGIRGDGAVRAVENEDWDPSVMSLVAFPEVLARLDENRDWTMDLGEAYIEQPEQVMDRVQALRARADAAGTLRSSDEIIVQRRGTDYVIEPPTPEVVYVPYYDPRHAYGSWWWPDYQPMYWSAWPGYSYTSGYRGFFWGPRVVIGSSFFFGGIDWRHRYVRYSNHRPWYVHGDRWRSGHRWARDDRRGHVRWTNRGDGRRDFRDGNRDGRRDVRDRRGEGRPDWRDRRGAAQGGRDERRDYRAGGRQAAPAPRNVEAQQGFFPPRNDAERVRRERPAQGERVAPQQRERVVPQPAPSHGMSRPDRIGPLVPQRAAPQPRVAPAPSAPMPARAPAPPLEPRAAPAPRSAPAEREPPPAAPQRGGGRGMTH